jgi:hypothetical protein
VTRVVIHIGSHKTGTTYLQRGFVALRPELRAAGIDYPVQWQDHLDGHHSLVRLLAADDPQAPGQLAALADEAARDGQALLLSSENFEDIDTAAIDRLASGLRGHAVEIVYFLRRWQGLVPSAWQEAVKQGGSETFAEFLLRHLLRPGDSRLLNPAPMLDSYAAAFGRGAIRLVGYDQLVEQDAELLGFFLGTILGVQIAAPDQKARINRALPPGDVEIIRVLNTMARLAPGSMPGGVWPMKLFFELAGQGLPAIAALRLALAPHVARHPLPDDAPLLHAIERQVLDRFGPLLRADARQPAAHPRPYAADYVAGSYWMDPSVPKAFADLRDAVRRSHAQAAIAA